MDAGSGHIAQLLKGQLKIWSSLALVRFAALFPFSTLNFFTMSIAALVWG